MYEDYVSDGDKLTDVEKSDESSRNESPKTQRERTNEINQLLQKLSRVEKAYNALKLQNGSSTVKSDPQDLQEQR